MDKNPPFRFCSSSIYGITQLFAMTLIVPLHLLQDLEIKRRKQIDVFVMSFIGLCFPCLNYILQFHYSN